MKPAIAYLICHNYDEVLQRAKVFRDEYALVKPHFKALGYQCDRVDWQDSSVDWRRYACVIPKAVWNYFDLYPEFVSFLKKLRNYKIQFQNPVESLLWNTNKGYLLDLNRAGIPMIRTVIHPMDSLPDVSWFSPFGDDLVLVKPAVSGGSKNTMRFHASHWKEQTKLLTTILKESDLIIQPFAPEVETEGEYSFFFFGGTFSHAVLKKPRLGDFRAHSFFGAELKPYQPSDEEIIAAYRPVTLTPSPCCYARTDLIRIKGALHLIELEIVEPYLYMEYAGKSNPAKAFANAVVTALDL
jgi:uncharacterized membrane protein YkvA (DUF1232 family)